MRRLTRYRYNNVPTDAGGRYFYINDGGDVWTPSYMPVKAELDSLRVPPRAGLHADHRRARRPARRGAVLRAARRERRGAPGHLTNTGPAPPSPSSCSRSSSSACGTPTTTDELPAQPVDRRGRDRADGTAAIYHKTEYRERRDHYAVYHVNAPVAGFDTDRDTFVGRTTAGRAAGASRRASPANSVASGWYPIGSHSLDVDLAPGEEKTFVFTLGYVENPSGREVGRSRQVINKTGRTSCSPGSRPPSRPTPP
jgi:cellobiose phosphorylase